LEADLSAGFGRLGVPPPPAELDDEAAAPPTDDLGVVELLDEEAMADFGGWDEDLEAGGIDSLSGG